ncbi:MAG: hypothetical protein M0C28_08495 [Candidatus Moduliflexus flocculans]|nr:hypothetical protein [Candidatus Moduliflexus flocculans]
MRGIEADKDKCEEYFNASPMIITALLPVIGYEKATQFITEFSSGSENNMRQFLEEKLGKELIDQDILSLSVNSSGL